MFTMTKAFEEMLLQHFIQMKLDIAYAINKPFPFFEALRDHCFITEKMYKESLQACQNLVPVSRVVHNVLTSLERTFHPSLLLTLFSQVNLHEYPSLGAIFRSFKNVGTAYEANKRSAQTLPKAPAVPAEGRSFQTLLPLPLPQPSLPSRLSTAARVGEPRTASQQITEILDEHPSPSHPAVPPPGFVQEGKTTPAACDNLTATTDEEADSKGTSSTSSDTGQASSMKTQRNDKDDSPKMPHSLPGPIPAAKNDSPAPNNLEMVQESTSTPAKQKKDSPAPNNPEMAQESTSTPAKQKGDSPAPDDLEMAQEAPSTPAKKKAKRKKKDIWSITKRRRQKKRPTQGVASPVQGVQKKRKVVDQRTQRKNVSTRNLKMVTRSQKARTGRAQISRAQEKTAVGPTIGKAQYSRVP
uniref:sp110 nuclear body protein-like n=1 Tax=Myodes glareolus TaxID=447135 RepID=UPI00201FDC15|nr:sp110 nuclear body protein-like [Myodes glareolus]XP_048315165.1 sp110 nuclear body protein-like [Myodes glareolus]